MNILFLVNGDKMKRYLLIFLSVFLLFSPTIAAITLHFLPDELVQRPVVISGALYDHNGNAFEFSNLVNPELALFIQSLPSHSSSAKLDPDSIKSDATFSARVNEKNEVKHIEILTSLYSPSYFVDSNGSVYEIDKDYFDKFLDMDVSISLYEAACTPRLLTFSNQEVFPHSASFNYALKSGKSINGNGIPIENDIIVYYSSDTSFFEFTTEPSYCNITVFVNGSDHFSGSYSNLDRDSIPKDADVLYHISAIWADSKNTDCFGSAEYKFYVEYSPAPAFSIDRTSIEAGEFILVSATNVRDPSSIRCTLSDGSILKPRFFNKDGLYYALLPFDKTLPGGDYTLSLACGEVLESFDISISERDRSASSKIYTPDIPLTEQMLADMQALISSIGLDCTDRSFASSRFINYEASYPEELYLTLGFGRVRPFDAGLDFEMTGVEFTASVGVDVHVINDGIVCASGENALLGKYIVVDHGYGLKSWYCNISEALHSVGDEIKKDEIIAKTGKSAFHGYTGLYLMTTVLDTPVSPYAIYEKNFVLP